MFASKIWSRAAIAALIVGVAGCGIIDNVKESIEEAQDTVSGALDRAKAKGGFDATLASMSGSIQDAIDGAVGGSGGAPNFAPAADSDATDGVSDATDGVSDTTGMITEPTEFPVQETVETDAGDIVITGAVFVEPISGTTDLDVTVDIDVSWDELSYDEGLQFTSSGAMSIEGGGVAPDGDTGEMDATYQYVGSFTINDDDVDFDVTVTVDGGGLSYEGTINGNQETGSF